MRIGFFLILLSIVLGEVSLAQSKADSLYQMKNYSAAGYYYLQSAQHAEFKTLRSGGYYNAACCYALTGKTDSAMLLLRLAIAAGYKNGIQMKGDNDLSSLHSLPEWSQMVTRLEKISLGTHNPQKARLITKDVVNFWKAYDLAQSDTAHRADIYRQYYLDKGTDGLQDYFALKVKSIKRFVAAHDKKRELYAAIRNNTAMVESLKPVMVNSFVKLYEYYPAAYFPDVYFVIGSFTSGGTASDNGLLIGLDQAVRSANIPLGELTLWERNNFEELNKLPNTVAHELIHFNQNGMKRDTTLLCAALVEGMADFIGELISGHTANERLHTWAKGREKKIWEDFEKEMFLNKADNWIANAGQETADKPADLGYWVGYQICKAYYNKSPDKKAAIRDMLNMQDSKEFYEKSGVSFNDTGNPNL
ncbi:MULTISPECIES: gliding motility protein GldB-related protein [Niastella]|uniref:DUF2268 domain-containing protein n=1 Tax=Niastella soli TaxID=2821487 RepID=A0ABS3Z231_9BACT|nr:DUF2268 domain-containing putative Zn-dependent protease [Niastella soli]MBO9204213.1 hypothetical protein [Niastella soli]